MSDLIYLKSEIHLCYCILTSNRWCGVSIRTVKLVIVERINILIFNEPTVLSIKLVVSESMPCIAIMTWSDRYAGGEQLIISNGFLVVIEKVNVLIDYL